MQTTTDRGVDNIRNNIMEAKRWLKQAERDIKAAESLNEVVKMKMHVFIPNKVLKKH